MSVLGCDRQNGNKPDGRGAVITRRKVLNMLRKTLSAVAAVAAVAAMGVGTAGVANASTLAPTLPSGCNVSNGVFGQVTGGTVCSLLGDHVGGNRGGDHGRGFGGRFGGRGGFGGGFLGGGLLGGGLLGGNTYINNEYANTYWQRDGVILPYSQVVSSCGCSSIPAGWVEVQDPTQVFVVPQGVAATGDGSCEALTSVNWGLPGWNRGGRRFLGHRG